MGFSRANCESLTPLEGLAGRWASGRHHLLRVADEFFLNARVERLVALGCLLEWNHLDINGLRNPDAIVKDRHHQAAVVLHHGRLTRRKGMGLCPSESQPHREVPDLRGFVLRGGAFGW